MRNSLWPIVALLLLLLTVPFCVKRGDGGGAYGPQLASGIYRGTESLQVPNLDVYDLSVQLSAGSSLRGTVDSDERVGLEVVPWSETVLLAEDDRPLTRAVIKALAERLSRGEDGSYRMVVIAMVGSDTMPVPGLRLIRVACPEAQLPEQLGDAFSGRLELAVQDPRGSRREGLRRQVGIRSSAITIELQAAQQQLSPASWPSWYASVGRAVAARVLKHWQGDCPELAWDDRGFRHRHDDWGDAVPIAPRHKTLRWQAAWQDPLQRGWTGLIHGKRYRDRRLEDKAIDEDISQRLEGGGWQRQPSLLDGLRSWRFEREDGLETFALYAQDWGFLVAAGDQREDSAQIIEHWIESGARDELRQHLLAPGMPAELAARMAEVLRKDADLAERLSLDPDSIEGQWVAWLRGLSDKQPSKALAAFGRADWDGGHRLGRIEDLAALLLVSHQDPQRMQLWWRQAGGEAQRVDLIDGSCEFAGRSLTVADGQMRLTAAE